MRVAQARFTRSFATSKLTGLLLPCISRPRGLACAALLAALSPFPVTSLSAATTPRAHISDQSVYDLYVAATEADGGKTLDKLRAVINAGELDRIPPYVLMLAVQRMRSSEAAADYRELAFTLTAPDRIETVQEEGRGLLAFDAMYVAAERNDQERAVALLPLLDTSESYVFLLADRTFSPLWPAIEAHIDDNMASTFARAVARAREAYEKAPRNKDSYLGLMMALNAAGMHEEVLALASRWRDSHDEKRDLSEQEAWAMQEEVDSLDALGRKEEARAKFDELASLPNWKYPWVINFAINRASYLEGEGDHQAALDASGVARKTTRRNGTLAAKVYVAKVRTCALYGLGKGKDADDELDFLRKNFDKANVAGARAAAQGLLCAGQKAEAEQRLSEYLSADPAPLAGFGSLLADRKFEGIPPSKSGVDVPTFILTNEALRSLVLKHSRLIPARFTPIKVVQWAKGIDQ